jgi:hypothetical protein
MIFWFEKQEIGEKSRIKGNSRFCQGYSANLRKTIPLFSEGGEL